MIITTVFTDLIPVINFIRKHIKIIAAMMGFSLILTISGCSTVPGYRVSLPDNVAPDWDICQNLNKHFIAIGNRGEFVPVFFKECSGISSSSVGSVKDIVNEIKAQREVNKDKKLLVFIHGGLDSPDGDILDQEGTIKRFASDIQDISCKRQGADKTQCKEDDYYPLFIIWPSAFINTYGDSIFHNYQGEWNGIIPIISSPLRFSLDIAEIFVRAPQSFFHQVKLGFDSEFLTDSTCFEAPGYYCVGNGKGNTLNFRLNQTLENGGKIGYPIKLLTTPIADPIGRRAWQSMVSRSHFGFHTPCGMAMGFMPSHNPCQSGALKDFFDVFNKNIDLKNDMPIRLIAHSMGAILASEIIREYPDLDYKEIVFMGAASSIRQYKNDVEPLLRKKYDKHQEWKKDYKKWKNQNQNNNIEKMKESVSKIRQGVDLLKIKKQSESIKILGKQVSATQSIVDNIELLEPKEPKEPGLIRFYNLSLHPFAEANETNYYASLPAGSLLEWIDYNFTDPSDLTDRTLGKWTNLVSMRNYFEPHLFKGQKENEKKEGGFDSDFSKEEESEDVVFFKRFDLSCNSPVKHGEFITPSEASKNCTQIRYWQPKFWEPPLVNHSN